MSTLRTGTTTGKYARKYPDFCYRKEGSTDLLDFTVDCKEIGHTPGLVFVLHFEANRHTKALQRERALVLTIRAEPDRYDEVVDSMLREVFGYKY